MGEEDSEWEEREEKATRGGRGEEVGGERAIGFVEGIFEDGLWEALVGEVKY